MVTYRIPFWLAVTLLLMAGTATDALAQQRNGSPGDRVGTLRGTVIEAATEEPVASATVALWSAADSSLVTGAITNADGTFAIEGIRAGQYALRVSFVGYRSQSIPNLEISSSNRTIDLDRIALEEDTEALEGVEVTAERSYVEVGVDRTTYNVENQPMTAGGSGLDVLNEIPSIEVDIDDTISLRGSQNVAIYLNGRPAPMTGEALASFLNGLSAESISRVEVIPNPSARYEPEGMSGIINIVLADQSTRPLGGSISANASTNDQYGASANVHFGSGPWSFFVNYGLRYGERERSGTQFRENRFLDPMTFLDQDMGGTSDRLSNTLSTTIDYELSDLNTLSFSGLVSLRDGDANQLNTYSELDATEQLIRRYTRRTSGASDDFNTDYRLTFQRVLEPRVHELTAEVSFEYEDEGEQDEYTENLLMADGSPTEDVLEQQVVDETEDGREFDAQIDYVRPLSDAYRMEAGAKSSMEWLDSRLYSESLNLSSGRFQPDDNLNNAFGYNEQVHAAYGILSGEWGPFGAQLGLRAERAYTTFDLTTTGESFNNRYFSVYPSTHVTYSPVEGQTFKLSYSKRVRRPNTWQLNPFGDYDDPTSRRVGNPYLNPQYTHAFETSYSRIANAYTLSLTPYFRRTVDAISWSQRLTDDGVTLTTFENFATENSYGAEIIGTLDVDRWLRTRGSFNLYQTDTDGSNVDNELSASALGFSTRFSATLTLPTDVQVQLSQFYRSARDVPGGRIDPFTRTDLAVQRDLLDGRANLSVRASDILNTMGFNMWRESAQYYQASTRDFNAQSLQVSLRYNFGQQDRNRRQRGGDYEGGGEDMEGLPMQ